MKEKNTILKKTARYVFKLFKEKLDSKYVYHDYIHTYETVEAIKTLGTGVKLDAEELETVQLAGWFHDTGFIETVAGHEEVSVDMAKEFFQKNGLSSQRIEQIIGCIRATKMPQNPQNLLEEVMCDADLSNLGSKDYFERTDLLRLENDNRGLPSSVETDWLQLEIDFLSQHRYHTPFAQRSLNLRKIKNISKLKKLLEEEKQKAVKAAAKQDELVQKQAKAQKPDRGIETVFRNSIRGHIQLSAIADNKANIMLSINAIIISIVLSTLVPQFSSNSTLIIPTAILLASCVLTIVFATVSTIPKVTIQDFKREDIVSRKANLLFFGNFYNMPLDDFEWGFQEMMRDRDYLYLSLTRDFYFLGKVLVKKYKYLRFCYNVFLAGLILSVIAFMFAFAF